MNQVNQQLANSVTDSFHMITQELSKPQEDVVAISVCGSTRSAIENVLKLYLESKGIETNSPKRIEDLVTICTRINNNFQRFDFSSLSCKCEISNSNSVAYCMGEEKINTCYRLLVELKDFVFNELKINGKF